MGLQSENGPRDTFRPGDPARFADHRPVAEVDAVEITDGDGSAAVSVGQVLVVAEDAHEGYVSASRAGVKA
jgi:hypothetical protein